MQTIAHKPSARPPQALGARVAGAVLSETALVRLGLCAVALHIVDDNFLQPEPGTSAGDHLASGLVPIAVLAAAAAVYPRLRAGVRVGTAMTLGAIAITPALEALALRSPIPVELKVTTEGRFPEPVEVAAYFVASESLANAAKHSRSTRIDVALTLKNQRLLLSVCDDGIGGADPGRGSGLVGLRDRVEALGGSLEITSKPGVGTSLVAALPIRH